MLKLISLQGFLNLSDDAIKKIADGLSTVGLEADGVSKFDDADDFLDAVGIAVDEQHTVVVAVENEEYNVIKKQVMGKFSLESKSSPDIAEAISREREELLVGRLPDMEDHCLIPSDAALYITTDGLYCGFCVEFANGAKLIYLPLDITRLDTLIEYVKEELGESDDSEEQPKEESPNTRVLYSAFEDEEEKPIFEDSQTENVLSYSEPEENVDLTGFEEAISNAGKAVYSLIQLDKTVAFVDCEYSKYIKAISKQVDGMPDAFLFDDTPLDGEDELEPQIALARKTRLALRNTGADFGAAISPILEGEKDGKTFYYSYIIIHDGTSAKAKKVSTSNQQGTESLIPHAFTLMFELLSQKAEILTAQQEQEEAIEETEKKKRIVTMAVCIAVAAIAIISAVVMVWKYLSSADDIYTTTDPNSSVSDSGQTVGGNLSDSTSAPLDSTSSNLPAITAGNDVSNTGSLTTDSSYAYPGEPTAGNVSASNPISPIASQSGVFTFTVYGYGHGVGMSQHGANYYAGIGWNYLEILAMYYYGTNLVIGEQYPTTVSFGGTSYSTRDYLAIAVESEMGASFETEALKAQAVAVYTYAKYCNYNVTVSAHAFDKTPSEKVYAAVDAVIGQYVSYNGQPCQTFFHSISAYKTASYANTFGGEQISYLSGGRPSYGDVEAENYMTTVTLTSDELKAKVYSTTGIQLTGDPSTWLKIVSHDACINENIGYISYIQVGGQVYTGYKFRLDVLGGAIRSHCFTVNYTPNTANQAGISPVITG